MASKRVLVKKAVVSENHVPIQSFSNAPMQVGDGKRVILKKAENSETNFVQSSPAQGKGPEKDQHGNLLSYSVLGTVEEFVDAKRKQSKLARQATKKPNVSFNGSAMLSRSVSSFPGTPALLHQDSATANLSPGMTPSNQANPSNAHETAEDLDELSDDEMDEDQIFDRRVKEALKRRFVLFTII